MKRKLLMILYSFTLLNPMFPGILSSEIMTEEICEHLRNRVEVFEASKEMKAGEERIFSTAMLQRFYVRRVYVPVWVSKGGPLPSVSVLVEKLKGAYEEGLRPGDYHLDAIQKILGKVEGNIKSKKPLHQDRLVDLELLLTDAFLLYASHLMSGRINPETIEPDWHADLKEADLTAGFETALSENRIKESLDDLLPQSVEYNKLRKALIRYRQISRNGGWGNIISTTRLKKGEQSQAVISLRSRLLASGDLSEYNNRMSDIFDEVLEKAVIRFQLRHGLKADGIVGQATLNALNVPVEERIDQINLNLERWRWLPLDLGKRYIQVNIANYQLDVVENDNTILSMKAIVGKYYRRTPVFSAKMTYLVLSPYWHVPPSIAVKDKIPEQRKNPFYFEQQHIKVFQGWGENAREVDPQAIDWTKISKNFFPYHLRQEPGSWNLLGEIKFMFPNRYDVYIHDTPMKGFFEKTKRDFSSGCIRIEKPVELAMYLLRNDPKWTRETIYSAIEKHKEHTIILPEPIMVHLLYWTAWADKEGNIHFRKDIYKRDERLKQAMLKGLDAH
ncbi:MAG: L,D-transpeptidase family protein [Desulfobacterales bacterium]